jgi:hypothetical protein
MPDDATRPRCPNCSTILEISNANRSYDDDLIWVRRRAACPVCHWRGFDWSPVIRGSSTGQAEGS